ncbi:MAG: hypothetical protein AAF628_09985 [Planctomycetota bacterium]
MRRLVSLLAATAAACSLVAAPAASSGSEPAPAGATLQLNGLTSAVAEIGSTVTVTVTGTAGRPALLLVDVAPGPVTLFGQSVALAFSPGLLVLPVDLTTGTATLNLPIQNQSRLHGGQLFMVAWVGEGSAPASWCWSNGADLLVVDRGPQLAGRSLSQFPSFETVRAFNRGSSVEVAVNTQSYPALNGRTADVYVVAAKTRAEWDGDPSLADVSFGGAESITFALGSIQANTLTVDTGTLLGPNESAASGDVRPGVGYDVVIDVNRNGVFDRDDLIDGYAGAEPGFEIMRDLAAGGSSSAPMAGPNPVTEMLYTGGAMLAQDTYYPTNIPTMGRVPLVVISHGNGHNYRWYDHLGYHLASYGYVVMSHQNNTVPGSHTAALTTLDNTDYLLGNLAAIGGGVLDGHIDTDNITWIGHSRGGDGVARAYDRLFRGTTVPANYTKASIKLISSIAPVDFGGTTGVPASHPRDVPAYHLWVGQADADVNGCANAGDLLMWYHLMERATRARQSISLYGVGHGDFHDGGGSSVASGPDLIGRAETHKIMRGYVLPLLEHYVRGSYGSKDYLWRPFESFRALGSSVDPNAHVNLQLQEEPAARLVIDDFDTNPSPALASSGAAASQTVLEYSEGRLIDSSTPPNFTWRPGVDPMNGCTIDGLTAAFRTDSYGCAFVVTPGGAISYDLLRSQRRFGDYEYLSFRAAQITRAPETIAEVVDVTFTVTLEDSGGRTSSINIGAYGGGIEDPYQRFGCGSGPRGPFGWNTEFETVRIRLADFRHGTPLNLRSIAKLTFRFGGGFGSAEARLALDEIELTDR